MPENNPRDKILIRPKAYCVLLCRCKFQENRSPSGFFIDFNEFVCSPVAVADNLGE